MIEILIFIVSIDIKIIKFPNHYPMLSMMQALPIFPSTESFHEIEIVVNYQSVNDSQPGSFLLTANYCRV